MSKHKSLQLRLEASSYYCSCNTKGIDTPCKIWTGYTQKDGYPSDGVGYGRMNIQRDGRAKKLPVHRVSKVLDEMLTINPNFDFYDKEDKKLFFELYDAYSFCQLTIDHLCRNSLCFEPLHLEWVHLTSNQQRKRWTRNKVRQRLHLIHRSKTRHQKMVVKSVNVKVLIKKLKSRKYRIK